MKDTLLWKLGWMLQTVQRTLQVCTGKSSPLSLSLSLYQNTICKWKVNLGCSTLCSEQLHYAYSVTLGHTQLEPYSFCEGLALFNDFFHSLLRWKPLYLFHHYVSLWVDWKQTYDIVLVFSAEQHSLITSNQRTQVSFNSTDRSLCD